MSVMSMSMRGGGCGGGAGGERAEVAGRGKGGGEEGWRGGKGDMWMCRKILKL